MIDDRWSISYYTMYNDHNTLAAKYKISINFFNELSKVFFLRKATNIISKTHRYQCVFHKGTYINTWISDFSV